MQARDGGKRVWPLIWCVVGGGMARLGEVGGHT